MSNNFLSLVNYVGLGETVTEMVIGCLRTKKICHISIKITKSGVQLVIKIWDSVNIFQSYFYTYYTLQVMLDLCAHVFSEIWVFLPSVASECRNVYQVYSLFETQWKTGHHNSIHRQSLIFFH